MEGSKREESLASPVLSDPGAALGRAVFYAVGSGVAGMGKSLFHVAGFAFEKTKEYINEQAESRSSP